jgi:membrane fusion protein, multidrug efflux system
MRTRIVADISQDFAADGEGQRLETQAPEDSRKRSLRLPLLLAAPIVLVIGALAFYLHGGRFESTDNAYVQSGLVSITPSVSGHVIAMEVHENQVVHKGQVLFTIDPERFKTALSSASAQLAGAQTQVAAARANYAAAQARVQSARAQLDYAQREAGRQKELLGEGISSQNQYDQAVLAVKTARQAIGTAQSDAASIAATLSGQVNGPVAGQPAVRQANAGLAEARLNLGYTVVRAPQDGIVTKVTQLQVGDYVTAGKPVFTLVGQRVWIEANFKESQLQYMRLGQPATVKVDAFPDHALKARVASFSPGTGNAFSLLPAENATGNWVKVVQRLPVELELQNVPADLPLHAGLSADVTVDTGHRRHLFGKDTPPTRPAAGTAPAR